MSSWIMSSWIMSTSLARIMSSWIMSSDYVKTLCKVIMSTLHNTLITIAIGSSDPALHKRINAIARPRCQDLAWAARRRRSPDPAARIEDRAARPRCQDRRGIEGGILIYSRIIILLYINISMIFIRDRDPIMSPNCHFRLYITIING